jgi:hypothetical protein
MSLRWLSILKLSGLQLLQVIQSLFHFLLPLHAIRDSAACEVEQLVASGEFHLNLWAKFPPRYPACPVSLSDHLKDQRDN